MVTQEIDKVWMQSRILTGVMWGGGGHISAGPEGTSIITWVNFRFLFQNVFIN